MKSLGQYKLLSVIVINLVIAAAYYVDNLDASYSELSSDIQNIIPVAQKFDNPNLFQTDLYLNDINNVKYYTPFYVQTLRFIAKFTNLDYLQAVNVLGFVCHLLFGILWFFLIYRFVGYYSVALMISVMIRGVVWLPGLEIWGISDLWTIMPRTLYISFLPLPFLLLSRSFIRVLMASFLIGLIFNFHPITGLGGILMFLSFLILYPIYFQKESWLNFKSGIFILASILLGMLPFILTYFGKTTSEVTYQLNDFNTAFKARIPSYFNEPILFLKQWLHFKTLFFVFPLFLFFIISFKNEVKHKKAKLLLWITIVLIAVPTISVPVEQFVNNVLGLNLRLSFQLIRVQKVAILPSFFASAFILKEVFHNKKKYYLPSLVSCYLLLLVFSQSVWFKNVPFFGDDISKTILPHNLSAFSMVKDNELDIDRMADYIVNHTKTSDLLCGSHIYRGATKRSVVFDGKGASMLIEGNPEQFILWQKRQHTISQFKDVEKVVEYLQSFSVVYFVTRNKNVPAKLIHTEGSINLYKL